MQQEGYSPAAASLGFQSLGVDIHSDASMAQAFEDMLRWRADIIFAPGLIWPFRDEVFRFARSTRIPVGSGMNILSRSARSTYGPDYDWISARGWGLLGARDPRRESADMRGEQPMKLELTLNMRLARSLGSRMGPLAKPRRITSLADSRVRHIGEDRSVIAAARPDDDVASNRGERMLTIRARASSTNRRLLRLCVPVNPRTSVCACGTAFTRIVSRRR